MSIFPRKPQTGDRVLQALFDSVCQIIDYLPSLNITGDNKTIKVNSFSGGKTIEAIRQSSTSQSGSAVAQDEEKVFFARLIGNEKVQLLNNNFDPISGENYDLIIPQFSISSSLPIGTILLVHKMQLRKINGSEIG